MLVTDAVAAVRTATAHDVDTQITDPQITAWIDKAYRRTRRWLSTFMPEFYAVEFLPPFLSGAQSGATIAKPDDYERLIRMDYQYPNNNWYPLSMRSVLNQKTGIIVDVSGQYRITYTRRPVDGYTTIDVPEGCEDIITEMVAARVRNRHDEDTSWHVGLVAQLRKEAMADLRMRYGAHPRSCLQITQGWEPQRTFFEQGSNFVIF
jgi:hypothetical protein